MQFEFNNQLMPQNLIEIEEIGQFAIEAWNDEGYYWYMVIRTSLGMASVATCGPVFPDISMLPSGYCCCLNKMPYKEDKIAKTISFFLNDKGKKITEAKIITIDEAISQFRDLGDYLANYSDETF